MTEEAKETAPCEDTIEAVAERLQFFFSDANIRADTFLRKEILKADGGHVPIEVLLRFNSIKQHTTDKSVVVAAAKTLGDTLVVGEEEKTIARKTPFTLKMMDDNVPLSLYVTNLPITEDEKYPQDTMKNIRALFEPYGTVALVKLRFKRTDDDKKSVAVGGAFVEFSQKEELEKAAEEVLTTKDGETVEEKKKLTVGDNTVEVVTMKEWLDAKKKNKNTPTKDESKREIATHQKPKFRLRNLNGLEARVCYSSQGSRYR